MSEIEKVQAELCGMRDSVLQLQERIKHNESMVAVLTRLNVATRVKHPTNSIVYCCWLSIVLIICFTLCMLFGIISTTLTTILAAPKP